MRRSELPALYLRFVARLYHLCQCHFAFWCLITCTPDGSFRGRTQDTCCLVPAHDDPAIVGSLINQRGQFEMLRWYYPMRSLIIVASPFAVVRHQFTTGP